MNLYKKNFIFNRKKLLRWLTEHLFNKTKSFKWRHMPVSSKVSFIFDNKYFTGIKKTVIILKIKITYSFKIIDVSMFVELE